MYELFALVICVFSVMPDVVDCECPPQWKQHEDQCYFFSKVKKTWDEARNDCKAKLGNSPDLVSIHTPQELDFLLTHMRGHSWLGFQYSERHGVWKWSDGSDSTDFTNWAPGEPNFPKDEFCTVLDWDPVKKGSWNNILCNEYFTFYYVCKSKLDTCPEKWIRYDSHCYFFSEDKVFWVEAKQRCEKMNSQLASIHNKEENDFITKQLQWHTWIGLNCLEKRGQWRWTDSSAFNYVNWWIGEPNGLFVEECAVVFRKFSEKEGKWNNDLCDREFLYVCQVEKGIMTASSTVAAMNTVTCSPVIINPESHPGLNVTCSYNNILYPCIENALVGSSAIFQCREYYDSTTTLPLKAIRCAQNGMWTGNPNFSCTPVCGKANVPSTPFISHGEPVTTGQWPWHIGLYMLSGNTWGFNCGGTLISEKTVITAAHCVTIQGTVHTFSTTEIRVQLGKIKREYDEDEENAQTKNILRIVIHDSYNPGSLESDIAIIFLESNVEINFHVKPVCFTTRNTFLEEIHLTPGMLGTVVGWGKDENNKLADKLMMVQLPVVGTRECAASLNAGLRGIVRSTTYCAGYANDTNVCGGDSGGGMVFRAGEGFDSKWILQGIVSAGITNPDKTCNPSRYSFFTRVGRYIDWLVKQLAYENKRR